MLYKTLETRVAEITSGASRRLSSGGACPLSRGGLLRVYLIRQPTRLPAIDHVALLFDAPRGARRDVHIADHGPSTGNLINDIWVSRLTVTGLPPVARTIDEVREFESRLPTEYVPLVRDCRHHVLDVLDWLYGPGGEQQ